MVNQSQIFPIFIRGEYQDSQSFARFQSDAQRAANRAKQEFQAVGAAIDEALSRKRNDSGALDLNLAGLREELEIQKARVAASREVAQATTVVAQAEAQSGRSLATTAKAARDRLREEERLEQQLKEQVRVEELIQRELNQTKSATDRVVEANRRRGTTASGSVINSVRAERTAFIQLGQQLQDVTVQAQLGTNAFQIFAQQAPQAAFALSGLANSADKSKAAIGRFATFLSGPWGAALFAASAFLGPLVLRLFDTAEAAEAAEFATNKFSDAQSILGRVIDDQTGKLLNQAQAFRDLALAQAVAGRVESQNRLAQANRELGTISEGDITFGSVLRSPSRLFTQARFSRDETPASDIVQDFLAGNTDSREAIRQLDELAKTGDEAEQKILDTLSAVAAVGVEEENIKLFERLQKALEGDQEAIQGFLRPRRQRRGSGRNTELRDAQRLQEFLEDSERKVANIANRFADIPSEVARVNSSVGTLDDLISDIDQRLELLKPSQVDEASALTALRNDAKALRDELADGGVLQALNDFINETVEQDSNRARIQRLLLAGREEEAEILRLTLRLEERFGDTVKLREDAIKNIVRARISEREELARIQEQQSAYLEATRALRGEIEAAFSGEGFDIEDIGRRLRASLLTEQIFGDALRSIESKVKESFAAQVDEVVDELENLEGAAAAAAAALSGVANPPTVSSPANAAQAASAGANQIVVTANRLAANDNETAEAVGDVEDKLLTFEDYARLFAEELTAPLLDELPPSIAGFLGPVLQGVLAGEFIAGTPGAILGGLNGLFGEGGSLENALGKGFSETIGKAFDGLQIGAVTSDLLDAFGINNSSTGAAIGGAIGNIFGPVGSIVGSLLGGLLGGVISGTPRASATIGGSGSTLSVTGTRGTSSSRREGSIDLADEVIAAVDRIADELGASVNAASGAVSIGIREDNIRVDTTGSGITKTRNGAIDFGDDAEAAILFAVQDLINDGVIAGLTASENRLLQSGKDLQDALEDVLTFRSVFDQLRELRDPVGFALDALNREFEQLIELFEAAGASAEEFAELEELYQIRRAEVIEQATERVAGALRDLVDDLLTGDNGLSLRDRRANALAEFETLRARLEGGDITAADDFADAARVLLDIERQLFGSTQGYFDRFEQVLAISQAALAEQDALAQQAIDGATPFGGANDNTTPIVDSIAEQTGILADALDNIAGILEAANENIGTVATNTEPEQTTVRLSGGGGGGLTFSREVEFF